MIRPATGADIPAMVRMGRDFIAASGAGVSFDADYLAGSFRQMVAMGDRLALVLDADGEARGMLCAVASRSVWEPVAQASELIFWIDPEHRGRHARAMIDEYTAWAKAQGCAQASLVSLAGNCLGALYGRAGFKSAETVFSKVL